MQGSYPSFREGFARSPGESEYPQLWKGLIGAWNPALGATGLTLWDGSHLKNRGTVTAAPFVVSNNSRSPGYVLDFDGSTSYVVLKGLANDIDVNKGTLLQWMQLDPMSANGITFEARGDASNRIVMFWINGANIFLVRYAAGGTESQVVTTGVTDVEGGWHRVGLSWDSARDEMRGYLDGKQDGLTVTGLGTFAASIQDDVSIGSEGDSDQGIHFNGRIGDTVIYDYALSNSLIALDFKVASALFHLRPPIFAVAAAVDVRRHIVPAYIRTNA